ncbi:MAG TPA: PEP-CTERM sorting domain-containing protein [Planctomycetota bacterium]|nr:PEP-CTERM sorting domain-containing protein [Planctomycetota bacterium]
MWPRSDTLCRVVFLAILALAAGPAQAVVIDEFSGSLSWSAYHMTLSQSGGYLNATPTGDDPQFYRNDFLTSGGGLEGGANPYVYVRMSAPTGNPTGAMLFWGLTGSSGYSSSRQQAFTTIADGQFHTYVIDLTGNTAWTANTNTIDSIRIDPTANTGWVAGQAFQVDWIRASPSPTNPNLQGIDQFTDGVRTGWATLNQMGSVSESGGLFTATSTGGDPFMRRDNFDFAGSQACVVQVRMRIVSGSSASSMRIYYTTTADGSEDEVMAGGRALFTDGEFHTYIVDFSNSGSGAGGWTNNTIRTLRLDPTGANGSTFQIDSVLVLDSVPGKVSLSDPAAATVIAGGTADLGVTVTNSATVANPTYATVDDLAYSLDAAFTAGSGTPGAASPGTSPPLAGGASRAHTVAASSSVAGTHTVTFTGTGNDSQLAQTLSVLLTVLDHSDADFADPVSPGTATLSGDRNTLWVDFGNVWCTLGHADAAFDILASVTTPGMTARLDLDSIEGSGDTSAIYLLTGDTAFQNLAAGSRESYVFRLDTTAIGDFSAQYLFYFSDEDLPGATSYALTLNVSGSVVPEPATAVLFLIGVGLARRAARRRRREAPPQPR